MTDERALALPSVDDTLKLGKTLAESGMFKDVKTAQQAFVKVLAGRELGIGAVEAMRGIDIIEGKLAPNAGLQASLIKRSGRYNYRIKEQTATRCVIDFFEDGQPVGASTYTIEEAKTAGLAEKTNWKRHPSDMLFARALTRGARRFCPDIFGGSVYSPEEMGEFIEGEAYEVPVRIVDEETGEIHEPEPQDGDAPESDLVGQRRFWAVLRELFPQESNETRKALVYRVLGITSVNDEWLAHGKTWSDAEGVMREVASVAAGGMTAQEAADQVAKRRRAQEPEQAGLPV